MLNDFPQALTIAGSDSSGESGMQADLHAFHSFKVYGASVLTSCVAGNSYGDGDNADESLNLPVDFINKQFQNIAKDFNINATKTGMLGNRQTIQATVDNYQKYDLGPLVLDPVILSKNMDLLLDPADFDLIKDKLIPLAKIITPNLAEAEKLTDVKIDEPEKMFDAAKELQKMGADNVLIKGYRKDKAKEISDFVLLESGNSFWMDSYFYETTHTNGTGDTLAAAIAAEFAKGLTVETAVEAAHYYVQQAIAYPINVAHKYGPINHYIN